MARRFLLFALMCCSFTSTGCVFPTLTGGTYELLTARPQVRLPLDEAPHDFTGFEWWYYTGRIETQEQTPRVFGTHTVVFHIPAFPSGVGTEFWIAHYAIVEPRTGEFVFDQSRFTGPSPHSQPEVGFDVTGGLVRLSGAEGRDTIRAEMGDGRFRLDVELQDQRGPILYTGDGYVPFGLTGNAFYYSRPVMSGTGTLVLDGEAVPITGAFWFDRQWGLNILGSFVEWTWFSVRLDDGNSLMLFKIGGGRVAFGAWIPPAGDIVDLERGDFTVSANEVWTSPDTKITYAAAWTVSVPLQNLTLEVDAFTPVQELDVRATTGNIYWEGLCNVTGTFNGQPDTGHAFVEQANVGLAEAE